MIFDNQLTIFVAIFVVAIFVIKLLLGKKSSVGRFRNPPSLPTLPVVGSLPFIRQFDNLSAFFMEKSNQLGPIFTFRAGNTLKLVLNTKDIIEEALVKNSRSFSSRPEIHAERIGNPNRKGIIFSEFTPQWKHNHQTASAIMKELKNTTDDKIFNEIQTMVKFLQNKQGQPFDPMQLSILVFSNFITNMVFGYRRDYDLGILEVVRLIGAHAANLDDVFDAAPVLRYIPPFKDKLTAIAEAREKILEDIETDIKRSLEDKMKCFVCRYIEMEGPSYDREQLNYTVRDLIFGALGPPPAIFRWLLVALANNPQIQRRLQSELDSVIPRDRPPTLQDEAKLTYHQATILEVLRWRTPVPLSVARLTTKDSELRGYFIPSGTTVISNLHAAHNNPTEWTDPDVFRPERFLDKDKKITGKDRVISFGLGERSCIGEALARTEIFLVLANVVQRFTVQPPEGQEKVNDKRQMPVTLVTTPESFSVRFIQRK